MSIHYLNNPEPPTPPASAASPSALSQSAVARNTTQNSGSPSQTVPAPRVSGFTPINVAAASTKLPVGFTPPNSPTAPIDAAPIQNPAYAAVKKEKLTVSPEVLILPAIPDNGPLKKYDIDTALLALGLQPSVLHRVSVEDKMPQPPLLDSKPSTASIVYIILAKVGVLDLNTIATLYRLYVPGEDVKNQTIRAALSRHACFFRNEKLRAWRLGNINEQLQPKAPGGAKRKDRTDNNDAQPSDAKKAKTTSNAATPQINAPVTTDTEKADAPPTPSTTEPAAKIRSPAAKVRLAKTPYKKLSEKARQDLSSASRKSYRENMSKVQRKWERNLQDPDSVERFSWT